MWTTHMLPLLSVALLCALWAVFQLWLAGQDPDVTTRTSKCGACGRRDDCDAVEDSSA